MDNELLPFKDIEAWLKTEEHLIHIFLFQFIIWQGLLHLERLLKIATVIKYRIISRNELAKKLVLCHAAAALRLVSFLVDAPTDLEIGICTFI